MNTRPPLSQKRIRSGRCEVRNAFSSSSEVAIRDVTRLLHPGAVVEGTLRSIHRSLAE